MTPHKIVGTGAYARARDNKGGTPVQLRLLVGMVGLGLVVTTALSAFAASQHVAEAIKHARVAVAQGQQNYPDELVKHAEEALDHADMAKKETSSPHLGEGIAQLREAMTEAEEGYLDEAVGAVEEAIRHFSEIQ